METKERIPSRDTLYIIKGYISRQAVFDAMLVCYDDPKEYDYIDTQHILTDEAMESIASEVLQKALELDISIKSAINHLAIDWFPPPEFLVEETKDKDTPPVEL